MLSYLKTTIEERDKILGIKSEMTNKQRHRFRFLGNEIEEEDARILRKARLAINQKRFVASISRLESGEYIDNDDGYRHFDFD